MLTNLERKLRLDVRDLVLFDAEVNKQQKSMGAAYILWHFLGWFGGHRFYMRRMKSAIVQLILGIVGIVCLETAVIMIDVADSNHSDPDLAVILILVLPLIASVIVPIIDAFRLYKWVRAHNAQVESDVLDSIEAMNNHKEN